MSESSKNICIRLKLDIPTGVVLDTGPTPPKKPRRVEAFIKPIPAPGAPHPVRPDATTGLGFICAKIEYEELPLPSEVRALVYPNIHYPASPPSVPPSGAVAGTSSGGGTRWDWTGSNEVPGAAHTAAGSLNKLAFWRLDGTTWSFDGSIQFLAVTGTSAPCGSGSVAGGQSPPSIQGKIYPAMWCVSIGGFPSPPLTVFNATWALRQVPNAPLPTWNNGADGTLAAKVELILDRQRGWQLTLSVQQIQVRYVLPFQGDTFQPLRFAAKQVDVPPLGPVNLPAIEVFPV